MTTERKLNGIWNAERILKEFLSLADKRGYIRNLDLSDDSPRGIEVRRFAAAMKAYGRDIHDFNEFEGIVSNTCSPAKMDEFRRLLKENLDEDFLKERVDGSRFIRGNKDIHYLFMALFKYRKRLYEVEHVWSGLLACPMSVVMVVKATNSLCQKHIKPVNEIIDRMLVLLMGDDYDKTFTEEELLPFGYPDVTDDELQEMIYDNL